MGVNTEQEHARRSNQTNVTENDPKLLEKLHKLILTSFLIIIKDYLRKFWIRLSLKKISV